MLCPSQIEVLRVHRLSTCWVIQCHADIMRRDSRVSWVGVSMADCKSGWPTCCFCQYKDTSCFEVEAVLRVPTQAWAALGLSRSVRAGQLWLVLEKSGFVVVSFCFCCLWATLKHLCRKTYGVVDLDVLFWWLKQKVQSIAV